MTRDEILAMPAGDEMNRLIGERIYGYRIYHYSKGPGEYWMLVDPDFNPVIYSNGGSDWSNRGERATEVSAWSDCPAFSHNLQSAWNLLSEFAGEKYDRRAVIVGMTEPDGLWYCTIGGMDDSEIGQYVASGETVQIAICRAALLTTLDAK